MAFIPACGSLLRLQSCITGTFTESEISGSMDLGHQRYTGVSYDAPNYSAPDPGLNMLCILMGGLGGEKSLGNKRVFNEAPRLVYYASADGPGASAYSGVQIEDIAQTSSSKATFPFSVQDNLRLMAGLEFVNMRSTYRETMYSLSYLKVPMYAAYQTRLGIGNIYGGLGPYLAYGIGGKVKFTSDERSAFDKTDGYKRFDAGLGFRAGYFTDAGYTVALGYDLGLVNMDGNASGDKTKNRSFSINVGYSLFKLLGRKRS